MCEDREATGSQTLWGLEGHLETLPFVPIWIESHWRVLDRGVPHHTPVLWRSLSLCEERAVQGQRQEDQATHCTTVTVSPVDKGSHPTCSFQHNPFVPRPRMIISPLLLPPHTACTSSPTPLSVDDSASCFIVKPETEESL